MQRLNVLPLVLPPLRERIGDLPALAAHLAARAGRKLDFTPEALASLTAYNWPGNVRELANLIAYVTALMESDRDSVEPTDLPPKLREAPRASGGTFYDRVRAFEGSLLRSEYEKAQGKVSSLAQKLGMDRSHLHAKLKEHGIHPGRPK
jgi:DNA-binding NtrC family response regulator